MRVAEEILFYKFVYDNFIHKRANDFCKINIILTTITNHVTLITENETWSMLMDRLLRRRGDKDCQTFLIFLLENSQKYILVTPEGKSGVVPVHSLTRDGSCVLCMQEEKP